MTSIGVVLAVRNRLKLLVSYKTASGSKPGSFQEPVERLISKLGDIQVIPESDNDDLYNEAVELAYEVESAVESLYLQQVEQQDDDHHHLSLKTKQLTTRIIGLKRSTSRTLDKSTPTPPAGFNNLMVKLDHLSNRLGTGARTSHDVATEVGCPSVHINTAIIGMGEVIKMLQEQLGDGSELKIIGIVGMLGIGKTTLARTLYDLTEYSRAWVHVGQNFQARDIVASILQQLTLWDHSNQEIGSMDTAELIQRVHKTLFGRGYLVVLDDVWTNEAWDAIQYAFPSDKGARIIITTRVPSIAQWAGTGNLHEMHFLTDEQSLELFKSQLSQEEDLVAISQQMEGDRENVFRKVAKIAKGHPLAIIVLAGMMRGVNWSGRSEICRTLSALRHDEQSFQDLLSLSYKQLPSQLKECFLYLGLFPEDRVVPVDKLYLMWMSEWMIPPIHHQGDNKTTRMDMAQSYMNELVQRRLVITKQKKDTSVGTTVKSFELHDLIHEFCLDQGVRQGFTPAERRGTKKRSPILRIAIDVDGDKSPYDKTNRDSKHVRSLLFFETVGFRGKSSGWPVEGTNINEYQAARVLDFDGVDFRSRKLPKGITKLEYLRYLGFRGCYLEELPSSYSKFPFLETLDLRVVTSCMMTISNIFSELSCLLHLFFPLHYQLAPKSNKLKLDGLTRLETLVNFHAGVCDVNDLQRLHNLRNFTGIADANNEEVTELVNFISQNARLSPSSLSIRKYDCYSQERFGIFTQVLTTDSVQALEIEGHLGKLPSDINWGEHITEMIFDGSEFDEDSISILGKLPLLTNLVLCNDAFIGKKMEITEENFLKLRLLKLSNLWALEELIVEDGAMSCLSNLELHKCSKLHKMSPYLIKIETLKEVRIRKMSTDFLIGLKDIPRASKWLLT